MARIIHRKYGPVISMKQTICSCVDGEWISGIWLFDECGRYSFMAKCANICRTVLAIYLLVSDSWLNSLPIRFCLWNGNKLKQNAEPSKICDPNRLLPSNWIGREKYELCALKMDWVKMANDDDYIPTLGNEYFEHAKSYARETL